MLLRHCLRAGNSYVTTLLHTKNGDAVGFSVLFVEGGVDPIGSHDLRAEQHVRHVSHSVARMGLGWLPWPQSWIV